MNVNWGEIVHWICTVFVAAISASPVWLNMWMRTKALERDMREMKVAHEACLKDRLEMGRDLATPVADIRETIVLLDDKKLPHTVRDAISIMKARAAT
jgi:hypothetical protein